MNGVEECNCSNLQSITESISTPTVSGPTSGYVATTYSYIASGASSNLGHSLQYQILIGRVDGSNLSLWGVAISRKPGSMRVLIMCACGRGAPCIPR